MNGRVFSTLREAIHHSATRCGRSMKEIAADLDWSPSMLSFTTTLGEDNARPFPADDAHLVKLMDVTGDDSVLLTLADKRGYELVVKRDRMPELVLAVHEEFKTMNAKMQLLLDLPGLGTASDRGVTVHADKRKSAAR